MLTLMTLVEIHRPSAIAGLAMGLLLAVTGATCHGKEGGAPTAAGEKRYLFYLHGKIVEDQGPRPKSAAFGYYEYEKILKALESRGFTVMSEVRPKDTDPKAYAQKITARIRGLIEKGVPTSRITVVGASKGGVIALYVSNLLKEREMNFVIISGLFKPLLKDPSLKLHGNVLSIHDSADTLPIVPEAFIARSKGLGRHKVVITDLGLGHGLLYQPYDAWMAPLVEWAR